jgi:hypothetical protein
LNHALALAANRGRWSSRSRKRSVAEVFAKNMVVFARRIADGACDQSLHCLSRKRHHRIESAAYEKVKR